MNTEKLKIVLKLLAANYITLDEATTLMYEPQVNYWTYPWKWYNPTYYGTATPVYSTMGDITGVVNDTVTSVSNSIENMKTALETELKGYKKDGNGKR